MGLRSLGRQLDIKEPVLEALDENHKEFTEKPYQMLLYWKKGEDKKATYAVFYMALCHPFIARTDLANNIQLLMRMFFFFYIKTKGSTVIRK